MRIPFFSWLFLVPICTLLLNFSIVFAVSHQCLDDQQFLLLKLKNTLIFNSTLSTKLAKWNQSVDCCSWDGVTCNEGRVIGLNLTNEFITGGLGYSSTLFSLQHLESLSLAYNHFNYSHEIPSEFGKLANLSYLNLSNAGFGGQIPIAISRLTWLVTLDLSTYPPLKLENLNLNMLVHNLSELMELYLDGIPISEKGNDWCRVLSSSLPNLRVLSMSYCNLSGPIDSSLWKLQSLSIIRLNGNHFSAPVPEFFADFKNLTSLDFSFSELNGKFPEKIFQIPTLQNLDISSNHLLQGCLPEFPPNGSFQTMVLSSTNFSGTLPHSIGNLKMLSEIDISVCNFTGSIPNSMTGLTQLVYLDMAYNNFNGSIPNFSMCKNLTTIFLFNNNLSSEITSTQWEELFNLEILVLSDNSLNGNIPVSLFSLPALQRLELSHNQFSGQLKEFSNASSYLEVLDLGNNHLEGPIPMSIFELRGLFVLSLGSNKFNNSLDLSVIQQLKGLDTLDLSNINLLIEDNGFNISLSSIPLEVLHLASCKLKTFPEFLRNQSDLINLDLSNNEIFGEIPNWIWELPHLYDLDLSYNCLVSLEGPILNVSLAILNLRSNQLQGQLPIISFTAFSYLDFSSNSFHSFIPESIGQFLVSTQFLFLSRNKLYGSIPRSICNATNLELLDLSDNFFGGTIPQCLIEMSGIQVLNLRTNNFNGTIPDAFPDNCCLQTLALNKNQLEGGLPKSLANCFKLEVLDIGNNHIQGTFPFYLKNTSMLRVLVLRSNRFYGPITDPGPNVTWPMLQIVDVASNNFTGNLPIMLLLSWKAMIDRAPEVQLEPIYLMDTGDFYYRDSVRITSKGSEMELVKILTIFTAIDFSCNGFAGPIPEEIGELKMLYILNLSHNIFRGQIPPSLGRLSNLESLDLSSNKLFGKIPVQLADGLIFLSVLNLSFNQLVGHIPFIKQFATFSETSFKGNERLCGLPLKSKCTYEEPHLPPPVYEESHSNTEIVIEWNYISVEVGFCFGFGIVIGPLMFWKRWRIWYYKHVDDIIFRIFPQLYLGKGYRRRQAFRNQELRN